MTRNYTGFTDSNNKKIMEDDVVKIKYSLLHEEFCLANMTDFVEKMKLFDCWCAIIGNIYENPELIELLY